MGDVEVTVWCEGARERVGRVYIFMTFCITVSFEGFEHVEVLPSMLFGDVDD